MISCKICGWTTGNRTHVAQEMMFGLHDQFTYLECAQCGCVQLLNMPTDMDRYYPPDYYSFKQYRPIHNLLRNQWIDYSWHGRNPIGWIVTRRIGLNDSILSIKRRGISKQARILDIGCGSGRLLNDLWHLGFRNIYGVDPYVAQDIVPRHGPFIYKKKTTDLEGEHDVIMLHHSFEHMDSPSEIMRHVSQLLHPKGVVILRIPVADSFAWRHYGVNWVNLDAPRHLYLHTRKSIGILSAQAGLHVERIVSEGNAGQFLGSEQYLRQIPLSDRRSYARNPFKSIFTRKQISEFKAQAEEINKQEAGDAACFYLVKSQPEAL